MSSTTSSSSSSGSRRAPLHERSNSEKNKLAAIRVVPYSPPRPERESAGSSHGTFAEHGHGDGHATSEDPAISSPTRKKASLAHDGHHTGYPSSPLSSPTSFSSSTSSLARGHSRGVSGTKLGADLSGAGPSTTTPAHTRSSYGSNMSGSNASANLFNDGPTSPLSKKTPKSRRQNVISVHPDKTFSVVLKPTSKRISDTESSIRSPPVSNYSTVSSHEAVSFDATDDDRPSSALSSQPDRSVSPYTPGTATPGSVASTEAVEDPFTSSPWNYRMVGGLRKVAKTPDPRDKGKDRAVVDHSGPSSALPTLQEVPSSPPQPEPTSPLGIKKASFSSETSEQTDSSEQTESTIEDTANYKVIDRSSPPATDSDSNPEASSGSEANYRVIGQSSPPEPSSPSQQQAVLDTPGSRNFIVHAGTSPATSSVPTTVRRPRPQFSDDSLFLRGKYSQESLVVPPLNPVRRKSSDERFGYFKQRSRESLRRAHSFSSISSVISQDTGSIFNGSTPNIVLLARTPSASSLQQQQQQQQPSWAPPLNPIAPRRLMDPNSHVWSSQLSTVMSEDEGSDRNSRQLSMSSGSGPDYRSMRSGSRHSRQMLSISSSLAGAEELSIESPRSHSRSNSRGDSGNFMMRSARELPQPPARTVRDVDEHGDGLADLHELHHKGSRPRLAHLLTHKSSDRDLHSSASSRAGSFSSTTLPVWAKIYYGSGERKWLAAPSIRSYTDDSRPESSFGHSGSPTTEQFPPNIFSPRRRPREVHPDDRPVSHEVSTSRLSGVRLGVRKMTSSIWSPHLAPDRRASRLSIWQPPSMTWSADKGAFGRRNVQILFFAVGFVFPFAWMIAAFLPLPPKPALGFPERDHSTTQFRIPEKPEPFARQLRPVDDFKYQSAKWWRNVNRAMSIIGLLVVGAIVALAIVGFWQGMKKQ
ncbi:uncharacterized protein JN550_008033 [Neoarthrinium moseri]|uniref:uncharacterized protein n=1 Tax=Neoarthrinium moseri TaxID=1658444 RepID=UPI001FDE0073|nr:uncharacterized protein JN550_008033 [Neoarthrinium moseri]KAI1866055.1 hypothetical protein JN550_008033 [Neoarthrinium moseri]